MLTKINEIYDRVIRVLPSSDRLRLATLILNNLVQQESAVIDESDTWTVTEEDITDLNNLVQQESATIDESDTWTEEDIADLSTFSLQYAATIYPDDEELI